MIIVIWILVKFCSPSNLLQFAAGLGSSLMQVVEQTAASSGCHNSYNTFKLLWWSDGFFLMLLRSIGFVYNLIFIGLHP